MNPATTVIPFPGAPATPRDVFVFINGILTRPGNAFAWTDLAERWFTTRAPAGVRAVKFEYFSPALLRRLRLQQHACDLARVIGDLQTWPERGPAPQIRLHLVGHSNGCELIARAVQLSSARLHTIHLLAGAVERDFARNGLGDRLQRGQIGACFCYCSGADAVLKYLARPSQIFSRLGLGYGDLGARGPAGVRPGMRVETHWEAGYSHSDWFAEDRFDKTMKWILHYALTA